MPFELDSRDRRSLTIAGGIFVLLIVAAFVLVPDTDAGREQPTTFSTASGGAKAAWLLLRQAGYTVERWERPPADLPDPAGTVLILANPATFPTLADRDHLKDFVARGGRIIATGVQAALFLPADGFVPEPLAANVWKQAAAVSPSAITRAAPHITLTPAAYWDDAAPAMPLFADEGRTRVIAQQIGRGDIIFWASATPLTNAGLREPGNLEFFLACIGRRERVKVLWDEYFHGYRQSLTASAAHSPLAWLFVHLGLIALAVLATYSRRSGPVFVAGDDTRLSPLEFVRTLGHLYERAGAASVAAEVSYSHFRYWLTRRLGVPGDASPAVLEAALGERWAFEDADLGATLAACEAARRRPDLKPKEALRLVRALWRYGARLKLFGRAKL
jgi:hypothetical protein